MPTRLATLLDSLCSAAPEDDYCAADRPCAYGCVPTNDDQVGMQMKHRLRNVLDSTLYGCQYIDTGLIFGEATMRSRVVRSSAEDLFKLGSGCLSSANHKNLLESNSTTEVVKRWVASMLHKKVSGACTLVSRNGTALPAKTTDGLQYSSAAAGLLVALRRRLGSGSVPTPWYANATSATLQVAVHVRRGDLATYAHWMSLGRWVPDEYYQRQLPRVAAAIWRGGQGPRTIWHVMSEGGVAGWAPTRPVLEADLLSAGALAVRWHVEATDGLVTTLAHMAEADVLLLGPSGYSTTAATYSLGLQLEVPISVQPGILERRGPVFRCLGSIHVLPAPPACSCLTNASANHVLSSYYRRVRPEASRRIGDALKREPVRSAHGCFMWCQSRPSLENFSEPTLPEQGHEAREEAAALPCREQKGRRRVWLGQCAHRGDRSAVHLEDGARIGRRHRVEVHLETHEWMPSKAHGIVGHRVEMPLAKSRTPR